MTVNIQFKRGNKSDLPESADSGTPLWCEDTQELYIGTGDGVAAVGTGTSTESPAVVTSISETSTDDEVPSAKCVYDLIGEIETLLSEV